jgi:hypothetical protein
VTPTEIEQRFNEWLKQATSPESPESEDTTQETETLMEAEPKPVEPKAVPTIGLFQNIDAHPYVLDLVLLKRFGPAWLEWEAETLIAIIRHEFHSTVSLINMQKLQAAKTLHFVDSFWQNWEVFVPCVMALNSIIPDFQIAQVPTVAQCSIAVDIANRIRTDVPWSDEMKAYLEVIHKFDGILCSTEPLDFVQVDHEVCAQVKERWDDVRKSGKAPTGHSVIDEQLRRLLIVHQTLQESREAMKAQLGLLLNA